MSRTQSGPATFTQVNGLTRKANLGSRSERLRHRRVQLRETRKDRRKVGDARRRDEERYVGTGQPRGTRSARRQQGGSKEAHAAAAVTKELLHVQEPVCHRDGSPGISASYCAPVAGMACQGNTYPLWSLSMEAKMAARRAWPRP